MVKSAIPEREAFNPAPRAIECLKTAMNLAMQLQRNCLRLVQHQVSWFGLCKVLLAASLPVMTACSEKPVFINTDVTGLNYAKDFHLTDHLGHARSLVDFKGKVVLIFFGFTHCPDVCPTTMAEMAGVMQQLGQQATQVQVLFVTLDPERDTQTLLAAYVPAFDSRFLGLYGDAQQTAQVAKDFKVFYQKVPGKTPSNYTIDHTAGSYVFDTKGRIRLFVRHGQGTTPIVHDMELLLKER